MAGLSQPVAPKAEPGLALTFKSTAGGASHTTTVPNIGLFIEAGNSPTPFLASGPFVAIWEGTIGAELRSSFSFDAELNGSLKLEINGASALETNATGGRTPLSKPVQLKKGSNSLRAEFSSPAKGDAFVRLGWTERGTNTSPIPLAILTHNSTPQLEEEAELRRGRELFLEFRCAHCHRESFGERGVPELKMNAPSFEGIGTRRNYEWMARWILDPKSLRPTAHMPQLLRGPSGAEDARGAAAYLASLKQEPPLRKRTSEVPPKHHNLFEKLQCGACHDTAATKELDPKKMPITNLAEKFPAGELVEFLLAPEAHFAWTEMPNFKLSPSEADSLANSLMSGENLKSLRAPTEPALLERGQNLVQSSGCLNCHTLKLANSFSAPKLADLGAPRWTQGCLAPEISTDSKAPRFEFTPSERAALRAFGATDRLSLTRHAPAEFAERQSRLLNCGRCHGQIDMVTPLEILGGKLRPEWSAKFIAGKIPYKPRAEKHPRGELWLEARMPAYPSRAELLASGLATWHGIGAHTASEPPVDMELAKIGQKLVGKDGGFSCVSCHAIGSLEASEVFESEGINLAYAAERLLPAFYRRWLRSPITIDPQTKMPLYFDEGKSPLTETLNGDAERQIDALWQYLRLIGNSATSVGPKTGNK